jgi:hypothetical protein
MFIKTGKILTILCATLLSISTIKSQDLINLVPNESLVTIMVDLNKIDSKANLSSITKLPIFEKLNVEIGKELIDENDSISFLDLKKYGINTGNKSWFYIKTTGEVIYGAFIFSIGDETNLTDFIKKVSKTENEPQIKNAGSYKYYNNKKLNIAWNSKTLAIYSATISPKLKDSLRVSLEPQYNYNYYDDFAVDTIAAVVEEPLDESGNDEVVVEDLATLDEIDEVNVASDSISGLTDDQINENTENYLNEYEIMNKKLDAKCDSITNFWCETNASIFLQPKGAKSIEAIQPFMEYIKTNPDAAGVLDYSQIVEIQSNLSGYHSFTRSLNIPSNYLANYYKGFLLMGKVLLNQDDIQLQFDAVYSPKLKEIYKDVKKTKITKKFLNYMNNDLMGYTAIGVDIEGLSKGIGKALREIYATIPEYGETVAAALDIADIFIDEQALYKIFTGDMVIALNGIKPVEVIQTVYDYDDEYNMSERIDTSMSMQPEVLFMAEIGNVEDVNKFLKLFVKSELIEKQGNIYSVGKKSSKLPVFIAINDNILFVSNNRAFVDQPKVLPKNKQLGKEHLTMFNKNTMILYANTSEIAKHSALQGKSEDEEILNKAASTFTNITIKGKHNGEGSTTNCTINLSKSDNNSLLDVFNFLNNFYLYKTKRFD